METTARASRRRMDYSILLLVLLLVGIGVVLVYDSSYYYAQQPPINDGEHFFRKQLFGAALGVVAMIVLSLVDYRKLERFKGIGLIASIAMLALVLIPGIGRNLNGASRWFQVAGVSIQPAEIAKFALILYMASTIARRKDQMGSFKLGIMPFLIVNGIVLVLIMLQPNLSTCIAITLLMVLMLFVGGARLKHLIPLVIAAVAVVVLLIVMDKEGYRFGRYLAFLDPFEDPRDKGYQLVQSLYALGSGGLFGTGFGMSRQKMLFLPYAESDFIFAIFGEEFGLIGCIILLALFLLLIWRGIRIALACEDLFGSMLATGITGLISIQVLINIAVVTGSMPPTGLPLPFISAGSSSLTIFMSGIGILLNISRSVRKA